MPPLKRLLPITQVACSLDLPVGGSWGCLGEIPFWTMGRRVTDPSWGFESLFGVQGEAGQAEWHQSQRLPS